MELSEATVIRSDRKTLAVEISREGRVIVRAPRRAAQRDIEAFWRSMQPWLARHLPQAQSRAAARAAAPKLTEDELRALAGEAKRVIPARVAYYAQRMGVTYGRITIRNQHTKWGSCTATGNLNFNCLLMLTPPEVLDSVVVHELCHRRHLDHSPAFYAEVRAWFPDYDTCNAWLKKNGSAIMARNPG